jgi:hypothetical protein
MWKFAANSLACLPSTWAARPTWLSDLPGLPYLTLTGGLNGWPDWSTCPSGPSPWPAYLTGLPAPALGLPDWPDSVIYLTRDRLAGLPGGVSLACLPSWPYWPSCPSAWADWLTSLGDFAGQPYLTGDWPLTGLPDRLAQVVGLPGIAWPAYLHDLTGLPAPALGLPNQPGSVTTLAGLTWPGTVWSTCLLIKNENPSTNFSWI